jgi:heme A synthase
MLDMRTESPWLHRYAIFVALCALIAIAAGAIITSLLRPIAGPIAARPATAASFESWHLILGTLAGILMIGLAGWLTVAKANKKLIQFGFIAMAVAGLVAGLGALAVLQALAPLTGILHALLGQVFFGAIVAIAVKTSATWKHGSDPIEDTWHPPLRSLALAVPAIVLLQTTLGASYRYRALGVIWHILNAMIVLLLILIVAVFLIRQFPQHSTLRPAAIALAVITSIQVLLGFTTFLMLILFPETSLAVVITSVLHVTTGALTFGASVALALQIRFNVQGPPVTHRSVTAT